LNKNSAMHIRFNLITKALAGVLFLLPVFSAIGQSATPAEKETVVGIINCDSTATFPSINHGDTAIAKTENGLYVMDVKKANRDWTLHFAPAPVTAKPNVLEIKLRIEADDMMASHGIGWNTVQTGPNKFDGYLFVLEGPSVRIGKTEKGHDSPITPWLYSTAIHSRDYNVVRIEQSADSLHRFYVNNELMFELKLPPTDLTTLALWVDPHAILYVDYYKLAIKK
jgi:hypothetical protein